MPINEKTKYLHFFDLYRTNLIWLGKNWDETKRHKNTAEAQFSSEPRKIFLFTFFDFFRVFGLFSVFSGFFSKKDEMKYLPMLGYYWASGQYLYWHSEIFRASERNFAGAWKKLIICQKFNKIIVSMTVNCWPVTSATDLVLLTKNRPFPASFSFIFVFSNEHYNFYNKYMWKMYI